MHVCHKQTQVNILDGKQVNVVGTFNAVHVL